MMTADQILEMIRRLPADEKRRIRRELDVEVSDDDDWETARIEVLKLAGCMDLGEQLVPVLDRETIYEERFK